MGRAGNYSQAGVLFSTLALSNSPQAMRGTVVTTEQDLAHDNAYVQAKAFVLAAIALSPVVWQVAFNYGVYATVVL